jgi:aspartyl/asparaginyl beta-hydroxylase (cupin superfamily)
MNYIILLIIFLLIILIFYNNKNNIVTSKCWISNNKYPEAQEIFNSRNIIKEELKNILNNDKWSIWSSDYKTTPIFTEMTDKEIKERMEKNYGKINSTNEPSWRLFGLILNGKILPNAKYCPNTIEILLKYSSKILNAGFSVLESGCYIGEHKDYNNKFYRLHIPLIIPKKNNKNNNSFITKEQSEKLCVLQVENDYRIWKDDEYFIFDDTCIHNAWNNTKQNRIILIVDLLK